MPLFMDIHKNVEGLTAEAAAEGARSAEGVEVSMKTVDEATNADLEACDALMIGSPTYWGSISTPHPGPSGIMTLPSVTLMVTGSPRAVSAASSVMTSAANTSPGTTW